MKKSELLSAKLIPAACIILAFFALKLTTFGIRLSDTNIYFLTAYSMLHGKILYKDIFFTDFPLFPYLSALYVFLLRGNLPLFYLTSVIETIISSLLLLYFSFSKTKSYLISTLTVLIFLFSFLVLTTTDHQTGVFSGVLLSIISYIFFEKKRVARAGIFIGLALMIKAYFLPILAAFMLTLLLRKNYKAFFVFTMSFLTTIGFVLLPTIVLSAKSFFQDVFLYSLTRGEGVSKLGVGQFFIMHDPLLFLILFMNMLLFRKNIFFSLASLFSILFFLLYQDIYYLYLNFITPVILLAFPDLYVLFQSKIRLQKFVLPTFIIILCLMNVGFYFSGYNTLQKVSQVHTMVEVIKRAKPETLYGADDITPALSYLSQIPLVDGVIDTNPNIFRKGILHKEKMTKDALSQKSVIITHGAYYPEYGIQEFVLDQDIVDKKKLLASCNLLATFPVQAEGYVNRINIFKCY